MQTDSVMQTIDEYIKNANNVFRVVGHDWQTVQMIHDHQYFIQLEFKQQDGQHSLQQLQSKMIDYLERRQEYGKGKEIEHDGLVFRIVEMDLIEWMVKCVLDGRMDDVLIQGDRVCRWPELDSKIVMAGSFNPFHQGHYNIAQKCRQLGGKQNDIIYELGISNPDKGDLGVEEILRRIEIFRKKGLNIRISKKFLFFDINKDYRNSLICLGYDTIIRVFMEKYYEKGVEDIREGFRSIEQQGNTLVIFGRQTKDGFGQFKQYLQENKEEYVEEIYRKYRDRFIEMDEKEFRMDISSTEIRNNSKNNEMMDSV